MNPPYLRWKGPEGHEVTLILTSDEVVIGRKSDADIVLQSPYISRQHAKLVKDAEGYRLIDLRSTHGTFVNGERIEHHKLEFGDRICLRSRPPTALQLAARRRAP